jgi:hypothetical protein
VNIHIKESSGKTKAGNGTYFRYCYFLKPDRGYLSIPHAHPGGITRKRTPTERGVECKEKWRQRKEARKREKQEKQVLKGATRDGAEDPGNVFFG